MKTAMLSGQIPFNVVSANAQYLQYDALPVKSGVSPVCARHWQYDDYVFQHKATWLAVGEGVQFYHTLNLENDYELRYFRHAQNGILFLSFGAGASPQELRNYVARLNRAERENPHLYDGTPVLIKPRFEHFSYEFQPGFTAWEKQLPVKILYALEY